MGGAKRNPSCPETAGDGFREGLALIPSLRAPAKQSSSSQDKCGLLRRGACHRARIRATRWLLAMTNSTRLICPPWQIESGHLGCGKLTRRANHQNPVKQIISEIRKFRLPTDPNHFYIPHCPGPQRGRFANRHGRWAGDAVDAAASGERKRARRMMLKRTAKSCRSDAPMLASSLREEAQATVSNKPGHRGEHEVSRKTIARGMPGCSGVTVVTTLGCLFSFGPEAAGASCARHSLRPL